MARGPLTAFGRHAVRLSRSLGVRARRTFAPGRARRPLYEGGILDDLLFGQPLNLIPRFYRARARRRPTSTTGISVVVVNYDTRDLLEEVLAAVRRFSPPDLELIVVDNASRDGSREWLKGAPFGARVIRLPVNLGHGRGLDIGLAAATHPVVVTLDSDAFPYSDAWLSVLTAPLADAACVAAGMQGPRDRLHPACAAYRRDEVLRSGTSFANYNPHLERGEEPVFGVNTWDTGELLFERLGRDRTHRIPVAPTAFGGVSMSDVVYHHPGSTTIQTDDDGRDAAAHAQGWRAAVAELLGS